MIGRIPGTSGSRPKKGKRTEQPLSLFLVCRSGKKFLRHFPFLFDRLRAILKETGGGCLPQPIKLQRKVKILEAILCTQPASPKFDALPTYKITDYPLEKRDYKPFAQAQVCRTPGELVVRLWAFEAKPRPGSMVEGVFAAPRGEWRIRVAAWADGRWSCRLRSPEGEERELDAVVRPMAGDDFQGEYWGISAAIPRRPVEEALGFQLEPGAELLGNFYKRSDDPEKPHHGSCWPADFAGGREYDPASMVTFRVVKY